MSGLHPLSPSYLHLAYFLLTVEESVYAVSGATLEQRIALRAKVAETKPRQPDVKPDPIYDVFQAYLFNFADQRTLVLPPTTLEVNTTTVGCISLPITLQGFLPFLPVLGIKRIVAPFSEPSNPLVRPFSKTAGHWVTVVIDFSLNPETAQRFAKVSVIDSKTRPITTHEESREFSKLIKTALAGYEVSINKRTYLNHQAVRDDVSCGYFTLRCLQHLLSSDPDALDLPISSASPWFTSDASWLTEAHKSAMTELLAALKARLHNDEDLFYELQQKGVPDWRAKYIEAKLNFALVPDREAVVVSPVETIASNSTDTASPPDTRESSPEPEFIAESETEARSRISTPDYDAIRDFVLTPESADSPKIQRQQTPESTLPLLRQVTPEPETERSATSAPAIEEPEQQPAPTLWQRFINMCRGCINWFSKLFRGDAKTTATQRVASMPQTQKPEQPRCCTLRRNRTLCFSRPRTDTTSAFASRQTQPAPMPDRDARSRVILQ